MSISIAYFVSYSHADKRLAHRLLDLIQPRLAIQKGFSFSQWIDNAIDPGQHWSDEISTALATCDFGLMLISPSFLASGFIRTEELPVFIEQVRSGTSLTHTRVRKPLVPVMLEQVPLDGTADLSGLEQIQIFRDRDGRSFATTRGPNSTAFADQLVSAITTKLRRLNSAAVP
ncbi:toll/interleukin-1 receptor domain-containing protein [Rhabdochromatium marinum]|uniref:toll/interleukin-1 receptor domain-containing protein n=1 Tax=Rhabdochromatium marinum TaxID=48729 RepID=UPI00190483AD|nr:toll/interleukin-1 receptor domain-containing protein [Rhabdochromatium marinum]MBK1649327.1 hypothetical protein [Rhabdochromatium marinum]